MTEVKSAYWDSEKVVKEIESGENRIRISICVKKGKTWISIREWYRTMTGEYNPGKHGLAFMAPDSAPISDFIDALTECRDFINEGETTEST
jgi:hypothetical protein